MLTSAVCRERSPECASDGFAKVAGGAADLSTNVAVFIARMIAFSLASDVSF